MREILVKQPTSSNIMKTMLIGMLIIILLVIIYIIPSENIDYAKYMGEKIVMEGDTLEIVDYWSKYNKLYLSNGRLISSEYADKTILKIKH